MSPEMSTDTKHQKPRIIPKAPSKRELEKELVLMDDREEFIVWAAAQARREADYKKLCSYLLAVADRFDLFLSRPIPEQHVHNSKRRQKEYLLDILSYVLEDPDPKNMCVRPSDEDIHRYRKLVDRILDDDHYSLEEKIPFVLGYFVFIRDSINAVLPQPRPEYREDYWRLFEKVFNLILEQDLDHARELFDLFTSPDVNRIKVAFRERLKGECWELGVTEEDVESFNKLFNRVMEKYDSEKRYRDLIDYFAGR